MTKHEVLKSMELATQAYTGSLPAPAQAAQGKRTASNGVEYYTRREGNALRITFCGSNSREDWSHNLAYRKKEVPYGNKKSKIRVHGGFLAAYRCAQVRGELLMQAESAQRILLAGHSYGAALAVLCAVDIQYNFPEKDVEAHLFGCPRVGNRAFAISYNRRVIKTIRVENGNDMVTRVPPAILGFRHVGARYHVGRPRSLLRLSARDHYQMAYYEGLLGKLLG